MQTPSGDVGADLLEVAGTHVLFDAYRFKHETMDWTGDRLVLVAFSVKNSELLCDADRKCLLEQGFVLPPVPECSTNDPPTIALPPGQSCLPTKLTDRVFGRRLGDLHFLEIFCGTGGLSAAVKKSGIGACTGIASRVTGRTRCPVLPLNLTDDSQLPLLWDVLNRDNLCAVHLSPPSSQCVLHDLCAEVIDWCHQRGILVTVENPASSALWSGPVGRKCMALGFLKTTLHQCMFGAAHPKHSALFHNFPEVRRLCLLCDGQHQHASWDQAGSLPHRLGFPKGLSRGLSLGGWAGGKVWKMRVHLHFGFAFRKLCLDHFLTRHTVWHEIALVTACRPVDEAWHVAMLARETFVTAGR